MERLTRAIAIRPGEGRMVALVAGAFAAVEAGRGLGEVGVDTLVLTGPGVDILPMLFIGLGLVGLIVTLSYGTALSRSSNERFFPLLLVILAAILGGEWLIALSGVEAMIPVVYVSVYAAGLLLLTAMWTVGGFAFDARQAKRLFPLLTSTAIVGSLSGSLSAIVVQRIAGAEILVLAEGALFLVAALLLSRLGSRVRPRQTPGQVAPSVTAALTNGMSYVAASPLMRLVAIAYVLLAILMFSLTFPFMGAMNEAFPTESELLPVLALFSAAVTTLSFLAGTLLANRFFARFGIATVALALPLVYLLGFGLWMVRFTLATAVIVRLAQQVMQRGFSNAAFSSLYNVIPSHRRGQVLAFMDGVPGQVGTMISGALLILATSLATEQVFLMGLVTAAACLVVLLLIRRAYAGSLVATLRAGHAERILEGGPGLVAMGRDPRIVASLRAASRSARAPDRRFAAQILGRIGALAALPELRTLYRDDDADVRSTALESLARLHAPDAEASAIDALSDPVPGVRATGLTTLRALGASSRIDAGLLTRLEEDDSPEVRCELAVTLAEAGLVERVADLLDDLARSSESAERAAALDAMARIGWKADESTLRRALEDPSPAVRAAAVRATGTGGQTEVMTAVRALDDPALAVRSAAADILAGRPEATPFLLEILQHGSASTQQGALLALDGRVEAVRPALLAWADTQVARAIRLRGHAIAFSSADPGSTADYLGAVVSRREAAIEARLLEALALMGAPEARGLIRRCLRAPDPEVRAQAIEALDALGDPRLARGIVHLLDREADRHEGADVIVAASSLRNDADPWVRALALRTLSEDLHASQRSIAAQVRDDPDPVVRDAVLITEEDDDMAQPLRLVSDIDRMLALRRVPIFGSLDPEDLQRVAAAAREENWSAGDVLMTEGEVGDELVVIVEGGVRVVHRDGDREHELRTYGEGDHIGELAVLREAPRAATVVAAGGGVRGLVIDGTAVGSLLRERPEAAMAMLATLADRISQQT